MKRLLGAIRYSVILVFVAGIFLFVQGFTAEDIIKTLLVLLAFGLGGDALKCHCSRQRSCKHTSDGQGWCRARSYRGCADHIGCLFHCNPCFQLEVKVFKGQYKRVKSRTPAL